MFRKRGRSERGADGHSHSRVRDQHCWVVCGHGKGGNMGEKMAVENMGLNRPEEVGDTSVVAVGSRSRA